jgi:hypothetical protein
MDRIKSSLSRKSTEDKVTQVPTVQALLRPVCSSSWVIMLLQADNSLKKHKPNLGGTSGAVAGLPCL